MKYIFIYFLALALIIYLHEYNIATSPQQASLFEDIARYTNSLSLKAKEADSSLSAAIQVQHQQQQRIAEQDDGGDGPVAKKRKLQSQNGDGEASWATDLKTDSSLLFYMSDVSFSVPQRKKFTLELTLGKREEKGHGRGGYLRARNQVSKDVEFGVPVEKIRMFIYELFFWPSF